MSTIENGELLSPSEIAIREFNSLRGRLLTAIEALGLPNTQTEAIKQMIKGITYQNQAVVKELLDRLDDGTMQFRYTTQKLDY